LGADIIFGQLIAWYYGLFFADEAGCIWYWIGLDVFYTILGMWSYMEYWLNADFDAAKAYMSSLFWSAGYFRIGHITILGIGAPHPPPPQRYCNHYARPSLWQWTSQ